MRVTNLQLTNKMSWWNADQLVGMLDMYLRQIIIMSFQQLCSYHFSCVYKSLNPDLSIFYPNEIWTHEDQITRTYNIKNEWSVSFGHLKRDFYENVLIIDTDRVVRIDIFIIDQIFHFFFQSFVVYCLSKWFWLIHFKRRIDRQDEFDSRCSFIVK